MRSLDYELEDLQNQLDGARRRGDKFDIKLLEDRIVELELKLARRDS